MMSDSKKLSISDDEEDLEALRLAALRTIKKKNAALGVSAQSHHSSHKSPEKLDRFNRSMKSSHNKRGRFFGSHQGRNGKNAQFNRNRNPNLIPISTMASEEEAVPGRASDSGMTVNLPQHRYCDTTTKEDKKQEETSKFNRYNKSDVSETESEEEEVPSEDDSPGKLHKTDSLEALMQELDDEIQGKSKAKENLPVKSEQPKVKKIKKKKRNGLERISTSDSEVKSSESAIEKPEIETNVEIIKHIDNEKISTSDEIKNQKIEEKPNKELDTESKGRRDENYSPAKKRPRSRSPMNRRFVNRRRPRNFHKFQNPPLQNIPFVPPLTSYPPPVLPFPNPPFNPLFAPPNVNIITQPPPFFERPLSPLSINTDSLTTATLAPLSPRSAAFVLQNKAIIERRKRSPRRSYSRSRSPSRSPRRSLTPRRSPRRSISPRRMSRSPRRLSPRRRSLSPRRRSLSPKRKNVGRSKDNSPKSRAPVRDRLGLKGKTEENKEKEKPKETQASPKKDEKPLDPILEARKRKFESNEIKKREGIIRLKPKDERPPEKAIPTPVPPPDIMPTSTRVSPSKTPSPIEEKPKEPEEEKELKEPDVIEELENLLREDTLLDIDLHPKVADIFSDEDSASDNEGRFKVKERSNAKPPVLSFAKLVNGEKRQIKTDLLPNSKRNEKRRDRRDRTVKSHTRSRTPTDRKEVTKSNSKVDDERKSASKKSDSQEKAQTKSRITLKSERHVTPMERRFERKIEIKIKNPSKYERGSGKLKFGKEGEEKVREEVKRKVELGDKEILEEEEDDEEPEIIIENNSGDEENSTVNEGDLRAQLSKKRAEKLHRIPVEGVSSRLLQNALQGAVFKKTKKKSKKQDITSSDGKLPIHLRLGIANNSDIFADTTTTTTTTKVKRKSRKRKNREVLEQVGNFLRWLESSTSGKESEQKTTDKEK